MNAELEFALVAAGVGVSVGTAVRTVLAPDPNLSFRAAIDRSRGEWMPPKPWRERLAERITGGRLIDRIQPDLDITEHEMPELIMSAVPTVLLLAGFGVLISLMMFGLNSGQGYAIVAGLIGGSLGVVFRYGRLQSEASAMRAHFQEVFATYLGLVAISMGSGMGVESAFRKSASLSDDWAILRLRRALDTATFMSKPIGEVLGELGERWREPNLALLSQAMMRVEAGARLQETLLAKVGALREQRMAELESTAGKVTEKLFGPTMVMGVGFLIFLIFPALAHLFSSL